jgi:hypothetical protein
VEHGSSRGSGDTTHDTVSLGPEGDVVGFIEFVNESLIHHTSNSQPVSSAPIEMGGLMKLPLKWIAVLLTMFTCAGIASAADEDVKAATDAAQQWLALVDAGKYAESWDQASSSFKEHVTKDQWQQALNNVRDPLGKVESRQFKAAEFKTELPKAGPGKYVVIQYGTKFANGGPTLETITLILDKDGMWRAVGYLIKPETD